MPSLSRGSFAAAVGQWRDVLFLGLQLARLCHVVSSSGVAVTFYKGLAVQEEKDNGLKKWTEFSF